MGRIICARIALTLGWMTCGLAPLSMSAAEPVPQDVKAAYATLHRYVDPGFQYCWAKADLWAQALKQRKYPVRKVMIFYANETPLIPHTWAWHIAPLIDGQDGEPYVLERTVEVRDALSLRDWMLQQTGQICVPAKRSDPEFAAAFVNNDSGPIDQVEFRRDQLVGRQCRYVITSVDVQDPGKHFQDQFFRGILPYPVNRERLIDECEKVIRKKEVEKAGDFVSAREFCGQHVDGFFPETGLKR